MIKQLVIPPRNHRRRIWLDGGETDVGTAFSPRRQLSVLTVMIDAELLREPPPSPFTEPEHFDALGVLSGLLLHRFIRLYRYSDEGPPSELEPVPHEHGIAVFRGWVELHPAIEGQEIRLVTFEPQAGHVASAGIYPNSIINAGNDSRSPAYSHLDSEGTRTHRILDESAARVAQDGVHADIYVSRREYLYSGSYPPARDVTICTPEEALTLVSLYLRAQGEFLAAKLSPQGDALVMNRGLFFWVGARELLPAAWRWMSACAQLSAASGDDRLNFLAQSLLQRFSRALLARDKIHIALNQPQNNDLIDESLAELDEVLVLLMASVDITARVAHTVLGITSDSYRSAWQSTPWLRDVRSVAPELADVIDRGTNHEATLTILRLLRNSVHGAALQGISVTDGRKPLASRIALPAADESRILEAMRLLGHERAWGLGQPLPGQETIEPGIFVDRLFDFVVPMLNDLMAATPFEGREGFEVESLLTEPPKSQRAGEWNPFSPWTRSSIRWQLGF